PLDPKSTLPSPGAGGACAAGRTATTALSFEDGPVTRCALACDFTTYPKSGCASRFEACAGGGCMEVMMDQNGHASHSHPLLWYYPSAWTRSVFSRGHSPIKLPKANKHPAIGVAKPIIPNFLAGPYTVSPVVPNLDGSCGKGYSLSTNAAWCNADLNAGTGLIEPTLPALTPWSEVKPSVGFRIPLDGQRDQEVFSGQFDYTGVLENYIVDYVPYVDKAKPSCVADGKCNKGFACDAASHDCVTDDDTISILA